MARPPGIETPEATTALGDRHGLGVRPDLLGSRVHAVESVKRASSIDWISRCLPGSIRGMANSFAGMRYRLPRNITSTALALALHASREIAPTAGWGQPRLGVASPSSAPLAVAT